MKDRSSSYLHAGMRRNRGKVTTVTTRAEFSYKIGCILCLGFVEFQLASHEAIGLARDYDIVSFMIKREPCTFLNLDNFALLWEPNRIPISPVYSNLWAFN